MLCSWETRTRAMNRIGEAYIGAEGMASRALASLRRKNLTPEGFMPVWGVVTTPGGLPSKIPHLDFTGRPYPDREVIGVILPLVDFTPLNSGDNIENDFGTLGEETLHFITKDVQSIAKTILPAARALEHISSVGLA